MNLVSSRQFKNTGFTFIEILIGLSIFSVVMLSLYGTFWNAMKINQKAEHSGKGYRQAYWAMERIVKDLENMVFYQYPESSLEQRMLSEKETNKVFLIEKEDGVKSIQYILEDADDAFIHKVVVVGRKSKLKSVVGQSETKEDERVLLIRKETPFADYNQEMFSEEDIEEGVLSLDMKEEGLSFSYAYLEEDGGVSDIVWKERLGEEGLLVGVRVEMDFFIPQEGDLTLTRDVFLAANVWQGNPKKKK